MRIISQAQLREEKEARQPKAMRSIFRRMIQRAFGDGTEVVDLAEQRTLLDPDALCDLYESARRVLPGCSCIEMSLEDIAAILSPSTTRFEASILQQMLAHTQSAVLSMTPDIPRSSGSDRQADETSPLLTVWFRP